MYKTVFNAEEKIWSGPIDEFKFDSSRNFGEVILEKLIGEDSGDVMQIDGDTGERLTKAEVHLRTIRCAQNLSSLGCTPEKRIVTIARNHHNLTPLLFSAICIGAPLCPLDVAGDGNDNILQRIEPSFIFCDADVLPTVQKLVDNNMMNVKLFTVNKNVDGYDSIESLLVDNGAEKTFVCNKIADAYSHAAVISCSSGSTGISKSIYLSHAVLFQSFCSDGSQRPFVSLNFSTLYWFSGVWATISPAFASTRVFTSQPFSTDKFFDLVEQYKVQFFIAAPCHLQSILKIERCKSVDLSSLFVCLSMGSSLPSVLVHTMKEALPHCLLLTAYGTTEVGGGVSVSLPNELLEHPTTSGHLIRGTQVKIINDQTGERCGINEEGEIFIKKSIPPMGYFRDENANLSAFDKEGYFITGDIGCFDEDGRLYISGRKKEMFKVRNFVVWPVELEDVIHKHPAVRYACVVNVYDDEVASDLAAAVVVKNIHLQASEDEIIKLIAEKFTRYKHLEGGVYFVDDLPMTPSGKVMRRKVKAYAENLYRTKKQNA